MKKYLSVVLAVIMVLSCISYAAPVTVGTVNTTDEVSFDSSEVFDTELAEEAAPQLSATTDIIDSRGKLAYHIDFNVEDGVEVAAGITGSGTDISLLTTTVPSKIDGMPATVKLTSTNPGETKDGTLDIVSNSSYPDMWFTAYDASGATSSFPAGKYTIEVDFKVSPYNATAGDTPPAIILQALTSAAGADHAWWLTGDAGLTTSFEKYTMYLTVDNYSIYNHEKFLGAKPFYRFGYRTHCASSGLWNRVIDDLKIWYLSDTISSKTVTFAGSAYLPDPINVAENGTFVPSEFAPSKLPGAATEFLGWSTTKGGEIITEPFVVTNNITLYANYKYPTQISDSALGDLAYYIDFDVEDGVEVAAGITGSGTDISLLTTTVLDKIDGMPATVKLTATNAGKTKDGTLDSPSSSSYPDMWFTAYDASGATSSFPAGKYTIEVDFKVSPYNATAGDTPPAIILQALTSAAGADHAWWLTGDAGLTTSFEKYTMYLTVDDYSIYNHEKFLGAKPFYRFGYRTHCASSGLWNRVIDSVKVWYNSGKVSEIELSFDANGKDVEVPATQTVDPTITFANYTLEDCGSSKFVGWSETKGGELITAASKAYAGDVTLYAVWDDYYYAPAHEDLNAGYLLAHFPFSSVAYGSQINNCAIIGPKWNDGTFAYPEVLINCTNGASNIWLNGLNATYDVLKYDASHPDNEIVIKSLKSSRQNPQMGFTTFRDGTFADGVYTFTAEVKLPEDGDVSNVSFVPYVTNRRASTIYSTATQLEQGKTVYIKKSILVSDKRLYDYDTMAEVGNWTTEGGAYAYVNSFGVEFKFEYADGAADSAEAVVNVDNFKVYYKKYNGEAKSYAQNSIRVGSPTGIRFMASISNLERYRTTCVEYGFVVTRSTILAEAGIDKNDFTFDSAVTKISGANFSEAESINKVFDSDAYNVFFTAVIYGIPSDMYADKLVVRPYVKYDDSYVYGDAMENSIYDVALKLKDTDDYEVYQEAIDKILAGEEIDSTVA